MTLDELIERLTEIREDLGRGDGQVLVASQPNWPLANVIENVVPEVEVQSGSGDDAEVWIAVDQVGNYGNRSPYAPEAAWG